MISDAHFVAPPTYTTHESMELNELSRLNDWEADYRQLKSGAFEAHFDLYASSNVRFTEQYCSREMIAAGVPPPDHVAFIVPLMPRGNGRFEGTELGFNDVVLLGENQETVYRTPDDFSFIVITTPLSGLNASLSALTDESSERFTNANRIISMPERLKADLVTSVRRVRQAAQGEESQGIGSPCLLEAEDALNAILGQGLSLPQTVDSGARGRRNRLRYLMQAREFIAENLNRTLSVQRIAIASGASLRSLETAFRENFGLSIVQYVKHCRLYAVRRDLLKLEDPGIRVKEVASAHGLLHAGQFAGDYRALFNETPSQTLKLRPS